MGDKRIVHYPKLIAFSVVISANVSFALALSKLLIESGGEQ